MQSLLSKKNILLISLLLLLQTVCNAQAVWEVGAKAGTNFYLGDVNSTIFNQNSPVYAGFLRVNSNYRFATKFQVASGKIVSGFQQRYVDLSMREEFNFFEYNLINSNNWTRFFSPYIFGGVGLGLFKEKSQIIYAPNIPFGFGLKYKLLSRLNIGVEWSMHKLLTDKFDGVNDPYGNDGSGFINRDWYSMATFFVSFDFGNKGSYCK